MTILGAKDPDADAVYELDARSLTYSVMRRDHPYAAGAIVKAPQHTGYYYECTVAGDTKHHYPQELARADGVAFTDGSVEWTARHPSSAGLPTISNVSWEIDPTGELEVLSEAVIGGFVYPNTSGGAAGSSYEVTARITWSTGQVDDLTVTIPVAEQ